MTGDRAVVDEIGHQLTQRLTDEGKLIEAGFALFRHYVIAKDAPEIQVDEMRLAYMAGAEHLFSSIMNVLDPGSEPTDRDIERMEKIAREIQHWRSLLEARAHKR